MSRIDELTATLCSGGVPYVALGEVASYSATRIAASEVDADSFVGVDNLLPDKAGKRASSYVPKTGNLTEYRQGDTLLGNIRPYLKKVWLADSTGGCSADVLTIRIEEAYQAVLDATFLHYLLSADRFFDYDVQNSKGGKMPRGSKLAVMEYRIPVPPIEVQQEVVQVLVAFDALREALDAELAARRTQYSYYSQKVFTSLSELDHPVVQLGQAAEVRIGQAPPTDLLDDDGPFAYVNAGLVPSGRALRSNTDAGVITIPSRGQGGVGVVGYQPEPFWCGPLCYRITGKPGVVGTRYLYHYMKSVQGSIRGLQQTGGTPALNRKELVLFEVLLPPLPEQERVVEVLDAFDALVTSTEAGLPAEIAARRRQFEYYRDRLISFEEAAA